MAVGIKITDVIGCVKGMTAQMQAKRIGGEVFHMPPSLRWQVEPVIGAIKCINLPLAGRCRNNHIKTAANRNDELLLLMIGMPAPLCAPRHIVGPKYPIDVKGDVVLILEEGEVASGVLDSR